MRKSIAIALAVATIATTGACSSRRQIDVEATGSEQVQGTSWLRFCDGPNAFIWIQSRTESEPDELEAIIYDHWACVDADASNDTGSGDTSPTPDADSDGTIEDEDEN